MYLLAVLLFTLGLNLMGIKPPAWADIVIVIAILGDAIETSILMDILADRVAERVRREVEGA